ncbi:uncharacterized protein RCC_02424 [Ramularia collo-cygni]|uniref:rRNA-processing protein EFG1 n=1 Tax=Ramularia collo-cygni TaxID=112498 RepID=A0A2D3UUG8_9PEZI|nr:uncharacterized protein RCC_02424 [Ramularia collo-cygni]CZT16590.1 uncharacterized protein RCC_02424 [Ramularia collo-cygni]
MATKRQAPDERAGQSSNATHQSRKRFKPNTGSFVPPENFGKKSFKKAHTTNAIKSNIRSLRRLLERELPADVRVEKERALQTAERELAATEKAKVRSDLISRYHKPRFFERQKAERRLKQARKALRACEGDEAEREKLGKEVDEYEVDLNYALFFPLDEHYVSLYPTRKRKEDGEPATSEVEGKRQGDKAMWELVRKCMAEGKNRLEQLREGKLTQNDDAEEVDHAETKPTQGKTKREKTNSRMEVREQEQATKEAIEENDGSSDDDTGGGFFE